VEAFRGGRPAHPPPAATPYPPIGPRTLTARPLALASERAPGFRTSTRVPTGSSHCALREARGPRRSAALRYPGRSIASRSVSELTARDLRQWPSRADAHSRAASPPRGPWFIAGSFAKCRIYLGGQPARGRATGPARSRRRDGGGGTRRRSRAEDYQNVLAGSMAWPALRRAAASEAEVALPPRLLLKRTRS
jgi:hypothetical protein